MSVSRETVLEFIETINKDHVRDQTVVAESFDFSTFLAEALQASDKEKLIEESFILKRKNSKYNSMKMVSTGVFSFFYKKIDL